MDLRRLVMLKAIVEEGTFARAAQKLCCTQSTVTFQIQQLEQELNLKLFNKIGRKMVLTESAKKMLPHVNEMMRVMEGLRQSVKETPEPTGALRIASGETLLSYKLPQVLKLFKSRAPEVNLSLQSLNCYEIRDALLDDKADLGIFYRVGHDSALEMMVMGDCPLVLVASPAFSGANFLQNHQHIPVSFIINEPQCVFRQLFEATLRKREITLNSTIELLSIESIKHCVAANLGVSYLPRFTVEHELRTGTLQELPFTAEPAVITALCAHHLGKCVTPAMKVFQDCVVEATNQPSVVVDKRRVDVYHAI